MSFVLRVVSLLSLSFFIVGGCVSSPNIDEPEIVQCTIFDDEADCINLKTKEEFILPVNKMTAYQCVSPKDVAELKNHHDALHTRLNQCETEKVNAKANPVVP